LGRSLAISLGRYTTFFQVKIYVILACVEIFQMNVRSEDCISICYYSPAAFKALWADKTMSTLVWQCQRLFNDISIHHYVGLFGVSRHYEICGNETVHELTRGDSVHQSVATELALGISGQNIKKKSSVGLLTNTCHHGRVLQALRDRFEN